MKKLVICSPTHGDVCVEDEKGIKKQFEKVLREGFGNNVPAVFIAETLAGEIIKVKNSDAGGLLDSSEIREVTVMSPIAGGSYDTTPQSMAGLFPAVFYYYARNPFIADLAGRLVFNPLLQSDAVKKSFRLLARRIGWRKYRQFRKMGYFDVEGKAGKFRFWKDKQGGVTLHQKVEFAGKQRPLIWHLCVQSQIPMPDGDVILSRYLEMLTDEEHFLKTAHFRQVTTEDEAQRYTIHVS